MKAKRKKAAEATGLELKYCERCGSLRLRPVGGEQIYCAGCSRHMDELPPAWQEVGNRKWAKGTRDARAVDRSDVKLAGNGVHGSAMGGVA